MGRRLRTPRAPDAVVLHAPDPVGLHAVAKAASQVWCNLGKASSSADARHDVSRRCYLVQVGAVVTWRPIVRINIQGPFINVPSEIGLTPLAIALDAVRADEQRSLLQGAGSQCWVAGIDIDIGDRDGSDSRFPCRFDRALTTSIA